jgi:hypothetical protein
VKADSLCPKRSTISAQQPCVHAGSVWGCRLTIPREVNRHAQCVHGTFNLPVPFPKIPITHIEIEQFHPAHRLERIVRDRRLNRGRQQYQSGNRRSAHRRRIMAQTIRFRNSGTPDIIRSDRKQSGLCIVFRYFWWDDSVGLDSASMRRQNARADSSAALRAFPATGSRADAVAGALAAKWRLAGDDNVGNVAVHSIDLSSPRNG